MESVFSPAYRGDPDDCALILRARSGDGAALERLVEKHQTWIYNIALRFVGRPADAEDVTQEVLVKMLTKLSTFEGRSEFRTWLYRIVANHALTMKRRLGERFITSFENHADLADSLAADDSAPPPGDERLTDEVKASCMTGMLLCLDRRQRLVMILGAIFGVESVLGAAILQTSAANFRQILSRARRELKSYMAGRCGLIDPRNPCRCAAKTRAAIRRGLVDPGRLQFDRRPLRRVSDYVSRHRSLVADAAGLRMQNLFRDHPLRPGPDFAGRIRKLLACRRLDQFIDFHPEKDDD